jgi:DNA-binding transcriptional ArsR family regulator
MVTVRKSPAVLFSALGDENRLRLVALLCEAGPFSINGLTAGSKITRQASTKHLHVMEKAGLVRRAWHGRESIWRLDQRGFDAAPRYLAEISKGVDGPRAGKIPA